MAFERLDLKDAQCFGWDPPDSETLCGWSAVARHCLTFGWSGKYAKKIDEGLAADVAKSYTRLAQGRFVDLDTGMRYRAWFENSKALWFLEIVDSPKAKVLDDDLAGFFSSEQASKFARRCAELALGARDIYRKVVEDHLVHGELMKPDPVKLDEILRKLDVGRFVDNLRERRYGRK